MESSPAPPPRSAADTENAKSAGATSTTSYGVSGILSRWRREDWLKRASLVSRLLGLLFSLLAFIIMATNSHGGWMDFQNYEEYRYVLAIAILATLYTGGQNLRQIHEFSTGRESFSRRSIALFDFFGDQICAYFLVSAASAGVPVTNNMRKGADNIFTDSAAAAISMEFLAFFVIALSALISGYKLSNQSYI